MPYNFEDVFLRSPAPTMILDSELRFVAANPAYLAMVGKKWSDLSEQYVFDAFPEAEDRVESMKATFEATLAGEETSILEIPFQLSVDGAIKEQWWTAHHAPIQGQNDDERFVIQFSENVTDQVKLREMRNAMMGELQHRVGNLFSIVFAIARQTGRAAATVPEFLKAYEERLMSLIKVNQQLVGKGASQEDSIRSVFEYQLAVHGEEALQRIVMEGPEYPLSMSQSQSLSMAAHELATNALKYGAIGHAEGRIEISWSKLPTGGCLLEWKESGLPVQERSDKSGYGTMLLTTILPSQLNGSGAREFSGNTFVYRLEIGPTSSLR